MLIWPRGNQPKGHMKKEIEDAIIAAHIETCSGTGLSGGFCVYDPDAASAEDIGGAYYTAGSRPDTTGLIRLPVRIEWAGNDYYDDILAADSIREYMAHNGEGA
jgi:hypothetical protein